MDTNAVIALLNDAASPLFLRIDAATGSGETIAVSSVVLFELWYGVSGSRRKGQNGERIVEFMSEPWEVLTFDHEDAREAGEIRAFLKRKGTPIGPYDLLIAAQARRRGAVLVTANTREFARVPGLRIEDWTKTIA